jgi:putative acetyltransferase
MTLPEGYDLRYTEPEDEPFLRLCLMEQETLHWFPMSEAKEVEDAIRGWMAFSKFRASLTATVGDERCAIGTLFLMPYKKVAHECLIKLVVAKEWRRQGIGASLLKNLLHLAKTKFRLMIVNFELVEGNPLEKILQNFDFRLAARQEGYFKEEGRYYARLLYGKMI